MADFNWDDAKSGATTGAVAGASAGTMVMPGIGTLIGGAGGALIGGGIGGFGGFGGGLWDSLSGQVDTSKYFQDPDATNLKMQQNEGVLQNWAQTGNGPSAAQNLLARNRSEGQQRALSNAKSMGAGNPALAALLANRQQSQVSADSALQSSTLRAQEQQNAMQAYQQALATRRQQSIDQEKARLQAEQKNAENNSGFIGSLLSGGMKSMGGMLGG